MEVPAAAFGKNIFYSFFGEGIRSSVGREKNLTNVLILCLGVCCGSFRFRSPAIAAFAIRYTRDGLDISRYRYCVDNKLETVLCNFFFNFVYKHF